jgi:hypothetical protein
LFAEIKLNGDDEFLMHSLSSLLMLRLHISEKYLRRYTI